MKFKIYLITIVIMLSASNIYGGTSISCTPQHITIASNVSEAEETTINWKRIDYHIVGDTAVVMIYKNVNDPRTKINPIQRDELVVIHNDSDKIVLMSAPDDDIMNVMTDVIFPKEGNGYSFYASNYPKSLYGDKSELKNVAKLYMLKCKDLKYAESRNPFK